MLLPPEDTELFRQWLQPKLQTIPDTDVATLTEYATLLLNEEGSEEAIKKSLLENLSEFLQEHTESVVDDVLRALKDKSYKPAPKIPVGPKNAKRAASSTAPIPSIVGPDYLPSPALSSDGPPPNAPTGPSATRNHPINAPTGPAASRQLPKRPTGPPARPFQSTYTPNTKADLSRKRALEDDSQSQEPHNNGAGSSRSAKQRKVKDGKATRTQLNPKAPSFPAMGANQLSFPNLPTAPLNFDPTDAMAILRNMAALFGMQVAPIAQAAGSSAQAVKARCRDYHTQGFCVVGSTCPYEHGGPSTLPLSPEAYDPNRSSLAMQHPGRKFAKPKSRLGPRGALSRSKPVDDSTFTTITVEQIPEPDFIEEGIRSFFSQFGSIEELQLQFVLRTAVIKYADHEAANRAYNSPKSISDKRFMKVFWFNAEAAAATAGAEQNDAEPIDYDGIRRRQDAAQQAYEEKRNREKEVAAKAEEIKKQLIATQHQALQLRKDLAAKTGEEFDEDAFLDAKLARLQAQAQSLYEAHRTHTSRVGNGGFRGGYAYSAGSRQVGHWPNAFNGGARSSVKRLDNRPKRIAIANVQAGSSKEEAIRQFVMDKHGSANIMWHIDLPDTLVVAFPERYLAEIVLYSFQAVDESADTI
ncbi:hypothetical protein BS50DRAFT_281900 [Corynespora cassiicola Philippines]|uniref:C3H1-type domain-containing protein n=1 Tax=Corynespora cassiicola Philippines TaxID=1448308 RepID=A0A2T2P145_CORCC|nr:hypothetical protein BS50DRAFT_281900 [Corynespora cassiicola Philippines]